LCSVAYFHYRCLHFFPTRRSSDLSVSGSDPHMTSFTNRSFILRYLVTFGQIWIKIILTVKDIELSYFRVASQAHLYGIFYSTFVHFGQSSWMAKSNDTHIGGRHATECRRI